MSWYFRSRQSGSRSSYLCSKASPTRSIEAIAREAILAGLNDEDAAEWVKLIEPTARTTAHCIAWYRARMRKHGIAVPGSRKLKCREAA